MAIYQQEHDRAKRDAREDGAEDEAREQRDRRAAEGADGHAEEELPHDDAEGVHVARRREGRVVEALGRLVLEGAGAALLAHNRCEPGARRESEVGDLRHEAVDALADQHVLRLEVVVQHRRRAAVEVRHAVGDAYAIDGLQRSLLVNPDAGFAHEKALREATEAQEKRDQDVA